MDKYITAPDPMPSPRRPLFEAAPARSPPRCLSFNLFVYDVESDSSLTPTYSIIPAALDLPVLVSKDTLLETLRTYLPVAGVSQTNLRETPSNSPLNTTTPGPSSSKETPRKRAHSWKTAVFYRRPRRPSLAVATLYLTYDGLVVPLSPCEAEWHYKNVLSATELLGKTEAEWAVLKEFIVAAGGELKCFINVRARGS